MPLDINLFRKDKGGDPELVRISERRRFAPKDYVSEVIDLDNQWRKSYSRGVTLRMHKNIITDIFKERKGKGPKNDDPIPDEILSLVGDPTVENFRERVDILSLPQLRALSKYIDSQVEEENKLTESLERRRDQALAAVGNIVHEDAPVADDEAYNKVLRTWGTPGDKGSAPLNHYDIMVRLGCLDTGPRAVAVAGGRSWFLSGPLVLLHQALAMYAMQFLCQRGYRPLMTPVFMLHRPMSAVAQLSQFEEELYEVVEHDRTGGAQAQAQGAGTGRPTAPAEKAPQRDSPEPDPSTRRYLIATSEQPIAAYYGNRNYTQTDFALPPEDQRAPGDAAYAATGRGTRPIRIAGLSSCFRREAGSHGRDTAGIFRVHQFDKVEQFLITTPQDSWLALEEMIGTSEAFFQSLGIPYRVVDIVTGALNNAAARKYDLECWFPASQTYRELVSCSNCTDYQSRGVGARYGPPGVEPERRQYVHMLNGTLCALTRTLCVLCETYQTEGGVRIPKVLADICGFDFIPFDPEAVEAEERRLALEAAAAERAAGKQGKK